MLPADLRSLAKMAYAWCVIESATRLIEAVAVALPDHLKAKVAAAGGPMDAVDIETVVDDALVGLQALLVRRFDLQAETPMEVIRNAVAPLVAVLARSDAPDSTAGDEVGSIQPGVPYGLAPASPAELGDEVLAASLAWGIEKARALTRPLAIVVTANLMDSSRFEAAIESQGYRVDVQRTPDASGKPLVAFVDLDLGDSDDAIRALVAAGVRVVAYGPHVDDQALVRARTLGAMSAEPRSRVLRNPAEFLPRLV